MTRSLDLILFGGLGVIVMACFARVLFSPELHALRPKPSKKPCRTSDKSA
jgi:hypothetical protein